MTPYRHPWLGVEVRLLATLTAVARTGSFRQAARELGYVQSAVSQQIARLERVAGARLVDRRRGGRTVRLTGVGQVLAERGERILGELRAARIELADTGEANDRRIRVAVGPDCAPALARVLETTRTPVHIGEVGDDTALVRQLDSGGADVAVGVALTAPGVTCAPLLQDPFVVLAPRGSRVAEVGCVSSPVELAGERLIVPASVGSHGPMRAPGLPLEQALRVPLAAIVPLLVADGHGVGLVPRSAADSTVAGVVTVATAGLIAPRRVMLGWHAARRRTTALETFCDAAVRAFLDETPAERPQVA